MEIYISGNRDQERRLEICGKETNTSFLIMDTAVDLKAWGFKYHWYSEEYRQNNGTKFLADFKALSAESVLGNMLYRLNFNCFPIWTFINLVIQLKNIWFKPFVIFN